MKGTIIGITSALLGGTIVGGLVGANVPAVHSLFGGATLYTPNAMKEAVNNAYNDAFRDKEALEKQINIYKYDYDVLNASYKAQLQQGNVDKATIAQYQNKLDEIQEKITNCQLQIAYYVTFFEKVNLADYMKVTFNVEGEDYAYSYIQEGEQPTIFITPEKIGFRFLGWSKDGVNVEDLATIEITENTTLTALFIQQHTITFTAEGITTIQYIDTGTQITTTPTPPQKEGYQFDYWMLDNEEVNPTTITITEDMAFVAHYSELYTMDGTWRLRWKNPDYDYVFTSVIVIEDGIVASTTSTFEYSPTTVVSNMTSSSSITENQLNSTSTFKYIVLPAATTNASFEGVFNFNKSTGKFEIVSYDIVYVLNKHDTDISHVTITRTA